MKLSVAASVSQVESALSEGGRYNESWHHQLHALFTAVVVLVNPAGVHRFVDLSWRFMQKGQTEALWFVRWLHRDLAGDILNLNLKALWNE